MNLIKSGLFVLCAVFSIYASANVSNVEVAGNEEAGVLHPLDIQAVTGESEEGNKLLSFTSNIKESIKGKVEFD